MSIFQNNYLCPVNDISISILIPIFNYDVIQLEEQLYEQCSRLGIDFEIRCIDDASTISTIKESNKKLNEKDYTIYRTLNENIGRSKIRNLLAYEASYENLIFLDCDSQLIGTNFIYNYLMAIDKIDAPFVIYGGTQYETANDTNQKLLHWHYGSQKESPSHIDRRKNEWHSFKTNNFCISKSIFENIKFDANITSYGYEDTKFAMALKANQIPIHHIANEVIHSGLEQNTTFLNKLENSLDNLRKMNVKAENNTNFETKLTRTSNLVSKMGLKGLLRPFSKNIKTYCLRRLDKKPDELIFLQIWKLMTYLYK